MGCQDSAARTHLGEQGCRAFSVLHALRCIVSSKVAPTEGNTIAFTVPFSPDCSLTWPYAATATSIPWPAAARAYLWPGSGVFQEKPKWVVAAELVETTRRYLRICARIDPRWIEPIAGHLVKRSISRRPLGARARFGHGDGAAHPVRPDDRCRPADQLWAHRPRRVSSPAPRARPGGGAHGTQAALSGAQRATVRRVGPAAGQTAPPQSAGGQRGCVTSSTTARVPVDVYDGATLAKWLRDQPARPDDDEGRPAPRRDRRTSARSNSPTRWTVQHMELPLDYQYEPGSQQDGVTLNVPLEVLNQVPPEPLDWLVPGRLEEKVLAMIRSLPKSLRTRFVPAPRDSQAGRTDAPLRRGKYPRSGSRGVEPPGRCDGPARCLSRGPACRWSCG